MSSRPGGGEGRGKKKKRILLILWLSAMAARRCFRRASLDPLHKHSFAERKEEKKEKKKEGGKEFEGEAIISPMSTRLMKIPPVLRLSWRPRAAAEIPGGKRERRGEKGKSASVLGTRLSVLSCESPPSRSCAGSPILSPPRDKGGEEKGEERKEREGGKRNGECRKVDLRLSTLLLFVLEAPRIGRKEGGVGKEKERKTAASRQSASCLIDSGGGGTVRAPFSIS